MNEFQHAVEGPIASASIMHQIDESIFWMRSMFPIDFEFRVYMTKELIQRIMHELNARFNLKLGKHDYTIFGCPVVLTEGDGARWWIGVPGFVLPKGGADR